MNLIKENTELKVYQYDFEFDELDISISQIEKALGYKENESPEPVKEVLNEIYPEIKKLVNIKGGFTFLDPSKISFDKDKFIYDVIEFNCRFIIGKRLRKSHTAALFTLTIGKELETLSKKYMNEGDLLKGYILDTIGSELAERTADLLEKKIEEEAYKEGWNITNRYSPGYCGWSVADQKRLFSLLPDNFCGIKLTDSSLMIPIKSVSGVIGLGPNVKKEDYECSFCDIEHCYKRNQKEK